MEDLAQALHIVRQAVRKNLEEAKVQRERYFHEVQNPKTDSTGIFGDPKYALYEKELAKWTRIEREYEQVEARLRRMHENAKRRSLAGGSKPAGHSEDEQDDAEHA